MSELFYQLALTLVPNIGDVQIKTLISQLGNATTVFETPVAALASIQGMNRKKAECIRHFSNRRLIEEELKFIERYKIKCFFLTDAGYPARLLNCYDPPALLFYKGEADLNPARSVAIVGTRSYTEQGKMFTEKLISDLASFDIMVVSGLATGIDAIAHRAALKSELSTVGVVGHGLDKIYPDQHIGLARQMIATNGGILTEFMSGTKPDRHNFPLRNRIVAGITDATIVIETHEKGGSMITAKLADSYNRDVFAVPGRAADKASRGCHRLIQNNKAILLTEASELLDVMGWSRKTIQPKTLQTELFIELSEEEKIVFELITSRNVIHIDEINLQSGFSNGTTAAALLNLELRNIVTPLPGKRFRVV